MRPPTVDPEAPAAPLRLAPPPLRREPPSEVGLGALQIVGGTFGMALVAVPIALAAGIGSPSLGVAALLAGPAFGGYMICAMGRSSHYYEGSCAPAIAGAYLGALTAIPLAYWGCMNDHGSGDDDIGCVGGLLVGFAAGYFIGTAVGATIGWHLGKTPRARTREVALSAPPPPPPSDDWPELRRRPAFAGNQGARVTVPVLAFAF
jgi:hypothetical protein